MNHLAHLYFAEETPESVVGNVGADFVKGRRAFDRLAPGVQEGVLLHRLVDDMTDTHPLAREARLLFHPQWRHLGRVFVDLFFDHYLARDWDDFHEESLREFLDGRYRLMREGAHAIGHPWFEEFTRRVQNEDRFHRYSQAEEMRNLLLRLEKRLTPGRFPSLEGAMKAFEAHYDELGDLFREFFPDLVAKIRETEGVGNTARSLLNGTE
ncbi:MAG: DUF479 domain-containing protein [Candidatus Sumerlaeia bacterium]|nr:DUF479 domain-containing protein [Candidatus Sumerlaeia bacterium]